MICDYAEAVKLAEAIYEIDAAGALPDLREQILYERNRWHRELLAEGIDVKWHREAPFNTLKKLAGELTALAEVPREVALEATADVLGESWPEYARRLILSFAAQLKPQRQAPPASASKPAAKLPAWRKERVA